MLESSAAEVGIETRDAKVLAREKCRSSPALSSSNTLQ